MPNIPTILTSAGLLFFTSGFMPSVANMPLGALPVQASTINDTNNDFLMSLIEGRKKGYLGSTLNSQWSENNSVMTHTCGTIKIVQKYRIGKLITKFEGNGVFVIRINGILARVSASGIIAVNPMLQDEVSKALTKSPQSLEIRLLGKAVPTPKLD